MEDQPLHPDASLVGNILAHRPDGVPTLPPRPLPTVPDLKPRPPSLLPSAIEEPSTGGGGTDLACGGVVIAKVNEVDTLFSPGELIFLQA